MIDSLNHDDPIEEAAADWLTLRAEGFSSAQDRAFTRWCRTDPRHAAAVARLEAACAILENMPLVRAELQPVFEFPHAARSAARTPARNRFFTPMRVNISFAAALAFAVVTAWQLSTPSADRVFATLPNGYERVMLTDGSVVELNAETTVRVTFAADSRRVDLVTGEAHFTVAHDTTRPFIVSAGGVAIRAVGTAFNVRLATTAVEVLVTEGKVAVSEVGPARAAVLSGSERDYRNGLPTRDGPTLLVANERTLIARPALTPAAPTVEKVTASVLRATLAWQERKLVFSETSLRDAVAQFNRRNRLQLILDDTVVAELPVGGTFAADNVEGFVRLLERSGAVEVERRDEVTVVLRAAR